MNKHFNTLKKLFSQKYKRRYSFMKQEQEDIKMDQSENPKS